MVDVSVCDQHKIGSTDVCVNSGYVRRHNFIPPVLWARISGRSSTRCRASTGYRQEDSRKVRIEKDYGIAVADFPRRRPRVGERDVPAALRRRGVLRG